MQRTGRVRTVEADELSGLVLSGGVLWTHNDSGDRPRVFALRPDGTVLADVSITGAQAVDWEDIAARGGRLYLGDIGDNEGDRDAIVVYRVPVPSRGASASAPAQALRLRYPDGAHDAETLLADPRSDAIAVVTKTLTGESGLYVAAHPSPSGVTKLHRAATLHLGLGGLATGGDVSADGRVIAVRTYTGFVAWARRPGDTLARAMRRTPCRGRAHLGREGQGEALALTADGRAFYTVPEGGAPIIRRYTPRRGRT